MLASPEGAFPGAARQVVDHLRTPSPWRSPPRTPGPCRSLAPGSPQRSRTPEPWRPLSRTPRHSRPLTPGSPLSYRTDRNLAPASANSGVLLPADSRVSPRIRSPSQVACEISTAAKGAAQEASRIEFKILHSSTGMVGLPPCQGVLSTGCPLVHPHSRARRGRGPGGVPRLVRPATAGDRGAIVDGRRHPVHHAIAAGDGRSRCHRTDEPAEGNRADHGAVDRRGGRQRRPDRRPRR